VREKDYPWFRHYSGTATDAKWLLVARDAQCRAGDVYAVWCALLERANDAKPRGSIVGFDPAPLAAFWAWEPSLIERVIAALRHHGLHDGRRLTEWAKRNPLKKDPTGAQRARNYRDRKRGASRRDAGPSRRDGESGTGDASRRDVTESRVASHIERDCEAGSLQASSSSNLPNTSLSNPVARESENGWSKLKSWLTGGPSNA
jgi:hypothetical protein